MKIIDISGWSYPDMWNCCKEYSKVKIEELPQPEFLKDKYSVFLQQFTLHGQAGTYIENRSHVQQDAPPVVDYPVEQFCFPAKIIDVGEKQKNEPVTVADLERANVDIQPGDAALLYSRWDQFWDEPNYISDSPYFSREAALWLIEKGIGVLSADFPRFDYPPEPCFPWDEYWEKVDLLLGAIVNLGACTTGRGTLLALPLKIKGAYCTPTRAIIIEE